MAEDSRSDKSETFTDFQLSLLRNLDSELRKNSDEVDFKKVKNVLELLNTMEVPKEKITIDQNKFEKDMKRKYGVKLKTVKPKEKLQYRVMRVACAVMIFVAVLFVVDRTTAKAFDFSLIEWIKSTADTFYFEFKEKELEKELEKEEEDKTKFNSDDQYVADYKAEQLKDLSEIHKKLGAVYILGNEKNEYRPEDIYYNELNSSIDITYRNNKNEYVDLSIFKSPGEANMTFEIPNSKIVEKDKKIGRFSVTISKSEDQVSGIFIYRSVLYVVIINSNQSKLENLIRDMRITS